MTMYFGDPSGTADMIRVHVEPGTELPTASSARQFTLPVSDGEGRFTPSRHQLEWVADGLYLSVDGAGRSLRELLAVASSLVPESGDATGTAVGASFPGGASGAPWAPQRRPGT